MDKKNIALLFGGISNEHEVSLRSAAGVLENISKDEYSVFPIGITKNGEWFYYKGDLKSIENGSWEKDTKRLVSCHLVPNSRLYLNDGRYIDISVCFPLIHGGFGEDGALQGLLDIYGIRYVGCDGITSGICYDKGLAKTVLEHFGIKTADYLIFTKSEYLKSKEALLSAVKHKFSFPLFVKPSRSGSSVGVSKVKDPLDLEKAMDTAFSESDDILIEKEIKGKELEVAVMGNRVLTVSRSARIIPPNGFYDYSSKYLSGESKCIIPSDISFENEEKLRGEAEYIYRLLGCKGLSRIDFFLTDSGEIILNEINTMPGFTSISMFPRLMENIGISYKELISRLIELSLE